MAPLSVSASGWRALSSSSGRLEVDGGDGGGMLITAWPPGEEGWSRLVESRWLIERLGMATQRFGLWQSEEVGRLS